MPGPSAPNPFRRGQGLSSQDLNAIQEDAWRASQVLGQGEAGVIRPTGGAPIIDVRRQRKVFARITGRGSGCANSGEFSGNHSGSAGGGFAIQNAGPNCYCGIEQISRSDGSVDDYELGIHWDAFAYPLVEMSENPDVPVDAIVEASISADRTHWEFLFTEQAVGESGSGCGSGCSTGIDLQCLLRCTPTGLQVQSGCFYVVINGQKFYVQFE